MYFPNQYKETLEKLADELHEERDELEQKITDGLQILSTVQRIGKEEEEIYSLLQDLMTHGLLDKEHEQNVLNHLKKLNQHLEKHKKGRQDNTLSRLLTMVEEDIREIEEYIDYTPGAKNKDYVKITELLHSNNKALIIDKQQLRFKEKKLIYNERTIHGITINRKYANLTVDHYTDKDNLESIRRYGKIGRHENLIKTFSTDNYIYFVEPIEALRKGSEKKRRKILGAKAASALLPSIEISLPTNKVWIRVRTGEPTKFALAVKNVTLGKDFPYKVDGETHVSAVVKS